MKIFAWSSIDIFLFYMWTFMAVGGAISYVVPTQHLAMAMVSGTTLRIIVNTSVYTQQWLWVWASGHLLIHGLFWWGWLSFMPYETMLFHFIGNILSLAINVGVYLFDNMGIIGFYKFEAVKRDRRRRK